MPIAYLALGSNLGDRAANLDGALHLLTRQQDITLIKKSQYLETTPVGGPCDQPMYLNAVVQIRTLLGVEVLFERLMSIEQHFGRIRQIKNGPRVIDLDLLLYDDIKLVSRDIMVPHPRMLERPFVLKPLSQIAPELCASLKQ